MYRCGNPWNEGFFLRLLHFSDLHLDAPFEWARPAVARKRRQALRDVLVRIVELAESERVDGVLCGGDLFEQDRIASDTGEFLRTTFARLDPIPVYVAPGNHDWLSVTGLYARTRWSSNVHVFRNSRFSPAELADGITLWGAAHLSAAGTPDLLSDFRAERPGLNLALFHGSELGGLPHEIDGKRPHAPFSATELERAGIAHAFLGHYHAPQDGERFTYPGNPDPLSFGERGLRGPVVITLGQSGLEDRHRHAVAVSHVHDLQVDVTGSSGRQAIRDKVGALLSGLDGIARVTIEGALAPEVVFADDDLDGIGDHLDAVVVRRGTLRVLYDIDVIQGEATVRGQFVRDVRQSGLTEDDCRRVITTGLRALEGRSDLEVD